MGYVYVALAAGALMFFVFFIAYKVNLGIVKDMATESMLRAASRKGEENVTVVNLSTGEVRRYNGGSLYEVPQSMTRALAEDY